MLLQSSLKGKALREYSALKRADHNDTSTQVKVVLRAYEQTPETYRERFRSSRKRDGQTHLEFTRELIDVFNRWRHAMNIDSLEDLCDLMVVDQLRHSVSRRISSYLGDQGVTKSLGTILLITGRV